MQWFLVFIFIPLLSLFAEEATISRAHIPYLAQKNEINKALALYKNLRKEEKQHDFEILEQFATILLEKGALSSHPEEQLLSLYGSAYASLSSTLTILEQALKSEHLQTQLAAVHLIARIDDDRCNHLLNKAMSSNFLYTRMEAAYQLALRKDRAAVGQIEALMHRVPDALRLYFPSFFGLIGTRDGIKILKGLLDDSDEQVRIEAILSVAKNDREDLLPHMRKMVTHPNLSEKEACAFALGELKDSRSLAKLKKLNTSFDPSVRLAASRARLLLGDLDAHEVIVELAKKQNLFALSLLSEIDDSNDLLVTLSKSSNPNVKANSALSLLKKRDARAADVIKELLVHDTRDWGFYPFLSTGRSLIAWKVLPSLKQHQKKVPYDLQGISLSLREGILRDSLELPEAVFLDIARAIFASKHPELIPLLVRLIENLASKEALALLKEQQKVAGAPLIRAYCTLSLYRLKEKGTYEEEIRAWLEKNKGNELIRFRKVTPKHLTFSSSPYDLTPEEHSRLLIEICETIANRHDETSIDFILNLLEKGNPKNRFLLAGLLLKALQ